ncbi:MAG: hypothetical protein JNL57_10315 [Bacteroidetes bacterium]|nr:hypothetical protein [Bacteroidota bacterium]
MERIFILCIFLCNSCSLMAQRFPVRLQFSQYSGYLTLLATGQDSALEFAPLCSDTVLPLSQGNHILSAGIVDGDCRNQSLVSGIRFTVSSRGTIHSVCPELAAMVSNDSHSLVLQTRRYTIVPGKYEVAWYLSAFGNNEHPLVGRRDLRLLPGILYALDNNNGIQPELCAALTPYPQPSRLLFIFYQNSGFTNNKHAQISDTSLLLQTHPISLCPCKFGADSLRISGFAKPVLTWTTGHLPAGIYSRMDIYRNGEAKSYWFLPPANGKLKRRHLIKK